MAGSDLLSPILAGASGGNATPKPLGYGFQPVPGGPTFRFSFLAPDSELGVISDFAGMVGAADVQGTGSATHPDGRHEHLLFDSDMRFMKGKYVGTDGHVHRGTFAFV